MTKKSFNLRKVVAIVTCLTAFMMFAGCQKKDSKSKGTKAGEELCACMDGKPITISQTLACMIIVDAKYNTNSFSQADKDDFNAARKKCGL